MTTNIYFSMRAEMIKDNYCTNLTMKENFLYTAAHVITLCGGLFIIGYRKRAKFPQSLSNIRLEKFALLSHNMTSGDRFIPLLSVRENEFSRGKAITLKHKV